MKSLNQIRAALVEAAQDTEAHFVQPTEAQHSVGPMRRQDKEEVKEEGGDEEIGPGTQLRTNRGIWCVVDEIDQHDSNYAWCTDEERMQMLAKSIILYWKGQIMRLGPVLFCR